MNLLEAEKLLFLSGNFLIFLNAIWLILVLFSRKLIDNKAINWLTHYSFYAFLISIIELILIKYILVKDFIYFNEVFDFLGRLGIHDMNFMSPLSYLIKFIFLPLFFMNIFKEPKWRHFYILLMVGLLLFELIQFFVFKTYQRYDSLSSTVKNLFIIFSSGLFLFKLSKSNYGSISLMKNTYFLIGIGLFIPALTELFLEFIFTKLYETDLITFYKYYLLRNASQAFGFLILIKAFWHARYLKFLPEKY